MNTPPPREHTTLSISVALFLTIIISAILFTDARSAGVAALVISPVLVGMTINRRSWVVGTTIVVLGGVAGTLSAALLTGQPDQRLVAPILWLLTAFVALPTALNRRSLYRILLPSIVIVLFILAYLGPSFNSPLWPSNKNSFFVTSLIAITMTFAILQMQATHLASLRKKTRAEQQALDLSTSHLQWELDTHSQLNAILEALGQPVVVTNISGRIIRANQSFMDLTGLPTTSVGVVDLNSFLPVDPHISTRQSLTLTTPEGKHPVFCTVTRLANGTAVNMITLIASQVALLRDLRRARQQAYKTQQRLLRSLKNVQEVDSHFEEVQRLIHFTSVLAQILGGQIDLHLEVVNLKRWFSNLDQAYLTDTTMFEYVLQGIDASCESRSTTIENEAICISGVGLLAMKIPFENPFSPTPQSQPEIYLQRAICYRATALLGGTLVINKQTSTITVRLPLRVNADEPLLQR